jgi:hypothetical protein
MGMDYDWKDLVSKARGFVLLKIDPVLDVTHDIAMIGITSREL